MWQWQHTTLWWHFENPWLGDGDMEHHCRVSMSSFSSCYYLHIFMRGIACSSSSSSKVSVMIWSPLVILTFILLSRSSVPLSLFLTIIYVFIYRSVILHHLLEPTIIPNYNEPSESIARVYRSMWRLLKVKMWHGSLRQPSVICGGRLISGMQCSFW